MKKILTLILVLGLLFRLYLSSFAWKPLIFDAKTYSDTAIEFLNGKWPIDCCIKNMGFGFFLGIIYRLFGVENTATVVGVNIFMDLAASLLIYRIASRQFNRMAGFLAFSLYIFNPFTSSYTGLVLAESVSLFLITFIVYILGSHNFTSKISSYVLFGILLGLLLFIRNQFMPFSILVILAIGFFCIRKRLGFIFLVTAFAGFLMGSSYSLVMNYKTFGKVSLIPPYSMKAGPIYANFYLERYPEVEFKGISPEYTQMALEYNETPLSAKSEFEKKYTRLFREKLKKEWPLFARNIIRNAIWLWDKDHLYTYGDPFYPGDSLILRFLNILYLGSFASGIIYFIKTEGKQVIKNPLFIFTMTLFIIISFLFPLLTNETRHSLIFYPLAIIWAGYSISILAKKAST